MEYMAALSKTNASVVGFGGNALPPPMLPSSKDYGCCFSCTSIENMRLYLSVLEFLINSSNAVPCFF